LSRVELLGGASHHSSSQLCWSCAQGRAFFCFFFLQRLPREIRVLLADKDLSNMRAIAYKAD
jgi:hypothetical protein